MTEADISKIVEDTVKETLTKIGIDTDKPLEYQKDMAFVRSWRSSSEAVKRQGILTAIGIITTGFLGLIWMALKGPAQ
ncbi:hypothetical protein [Brucella anthropi]|uniref:hypothetical protein n=1 Tax=Brucella anthropi TaxID=529 RepID=UPI000F672B6C|nr:hypothetical protein [Brucella anthropi]RRY03819.1 hypothetical protein EGJ58_22210 [Brucella anthropi]